MDKKIFMSVLVLALSGMFMACGNSSDEIEKAPSELIIGENSRGGDDVDGSDDGENVTEWPTDDEMSSKTYFPVGTKWQETWAATRMKEPGGDGIKPVYKAPRRIDSVYKDMYEDTPYQYFTMTFEVDRDTIIRGKTLHHVTLSSDFVQPTESRTEWPLIYGDYTDFFIEEEMGSIYYVAEFFIDKKGVSHRDLVCDFVWTQGKELLHVTMCNYDGYDSGDKIESFGTVSQSTVKQKKLLDGSYHLYMPSANLYQGIGCATGSMFLIESGLQPTTLFEVVREPVGLARFYRDGKLLYEDQELIDLLTF